MVTSERAGGVYFVADDVRLALHSDAYGLKDRDKAVLTTWIANQNRQKDGIPIINGKIIQRVKTRDMNQLLLFIAPIFFSVQWGKIANQASGSA